MALVTMLSMHECSGGGGGGGGGDEAVRCVIIIMKTTLVRQCIKFENLFFFNLTVINHVATTIHTALHIFQYWRSFCFISLSLTLAGIPFVCVCVFVFTILLKPFSNGQKQIHEKMEEREQASERVAKEMRHAVAIF